jgi:hypothetical protein
MKLKPTRSRTRKLAEEAAEFGMTSTIANGISYDLLSVSSPDLSFKIPGFIYLNWQCLVSPMQSQGCVFQGGENRNP